jgi:hypothetical protein
VCYIKLEIVNGRNESLTFEGILIK